jgi:hypothetical protein
MPDVAFDAASSAAPATGTTRTWSLTVGSGANRLLLVYPEIATVNDWVTGVTYNGVAMTRILLQGDSVGMTGYLYGLVAPATGTNNIVITSSTSVAIAGCAYAVSNANQTTSMEGLFGGNNGGAGLSTRLWGPTTTTTDRALVVLFTWNSAEVPVASTNSTSRSVVNKEASVFDRGAVTTPAGDVYMTQTTTAATRWSTISVAIAPVTAAGGSVPALAMVTMRRRRGGI